MTSMAVTTPSVVTADAIPAELRAIPQWVLWRRLSNPIAIPLDLEPEISRLLGLARRCARGSQDETTGRPRR